MGSIAASVLIVLASLSSVVASQTYQPSEIIPEMREQFVKELKDIKGDSPLVWEPGLIITVFLKVVELFIDYIINDGWFPGMTFIFTYLFLVLVLLAILFNNP